MNLRFLWFTYIFHYCCCLNLSVSLSHSLLFLLWFLFASAFLKGWESERERDSFFLSSHYLHLSPLTLHSPSFFCLHSNKKYSISIIWSGWMCLMNWIGLKYQNNSTHWDRHSKETKANQINSLALKFGKRLPICFVICICLFYFVSANSLAWDGSFDRSSFDCRVT